MRIALTGIGIAGAALLIDWAAGPGGAVAFTFFSIWALLMVSHAVAAGPRSTSVDMSIDTQVDGPAEEHTEDPSVRRLPQ